MSMLDKNVKCWNCKNPWHECLGKCFASRVPYVSTNANKKTAPTTLERFKALDLEIQSLTGQLILKQQELYHLSRQLAKELDPPSTKQLGYVMVHQIAPCRRCGKSTTWRAPDGIAEHRNCHAQSANSRTLNIMDGLMDGTIDPEGLL